MESTSENKNNQFSLKWNGFTDNFINSLELSLDNQDFVDVTLVCEEGSIKAHRLVLSASSYFFQRVLKENSCPHPVIVLKGISLSELETLMMFIYHGEAKTFQENVPRLLEAAQFLEIRGLTSSQSCQVSSESKTSSEASGLNNSANDFFQTSVHSTTQESNNFSQVETFNPYVRNYCQTREESPQIKENERVDIKQEPLEEEESNSQDYSGQTFVSSPSELAENKPDGRVKMHGKVNSCLPRTNFTLQEMLMLQQQKKLAFYEPRPCPKCHKVYRDAATLRNHLSSMHELLRHHASCACGRTFPTKHDLHVHRRCDHRPTV